MPDRIVREAARYSKRLESVSIHAELMFWRLITVPDDYGIFYADPAALRAAIWPMNSRNIRVPEIARWCDELARAGIIAEYEVEGVRYIELLRFGQVGPGKLKYPRRRYPPRPDAPVDPGQPTKDLATDPPPPPVSRKRKEEKRKPEWAKPTQATAEPRRPDGPAPAGDKATTEDRHESRPRPLWETWEEQ